MTEAEWLACADPHRMLEFLRGQASDRTLRLFACACCRRIWHLLADVRSRSAVEVMERYADGCATEGERRAAQKAAQAVWDPGGEDEADLDNVAAWAADVLVRGEFIGDQWVLRGEQWASVVAESAAAQQGEAVEEATRTQAALVRDIFHPFRPVPVDPAWQKPTVRGLARSAYEERQVPSGELDPARLAVLADALEEAGCDNADILGHLRSPGLHVRGCWAVDAVLAKPRRGGPRGR